MQRPWALTRPRVERDAAAGVIRFSGGALYEPAKTPALWRRVAALGTLKDIDPWWLALMRYGPLTDATLGIRDEEPERRLWETTIAGLGEVADLWVETSAGRNLWELLPAATPIEITPGYRRLRTELRRVAEGAAVKLELEGVMLTPRPVNLDGFLWLAAAESLRDGHRFKHCEQCGGWFSVQRTDARFCSQVCKNKRQSTKKAPETA